VPLKKIEKLLSNIFENTFSKIFPSELEEIEISNNLIRELETAKKGTTIPHNIEIRISKHDYRTIEPKEILLCLSLEEKILEYANDQNYILTHSPQVQLIIKKHLKKGMVQFASSFQLAPMNRKGYLIINNKFKKLIKTNNIGRSSECQVMLEGTSVSREHAQIILNSGVYLIRDLNSTNGTFINDVMVKPGNNEPLKHNDIIKIGDEVMTFKLAIVRSRK
jgi:hypothetical protein